MKDEIVLYQPNATIQLEVHLKDETVWLNRNQMAVLFDRDVKTIGKHINNALREELAPTATKNATTQEQNQVVANFATPYENQVVAKFATPYEHGSHKGQMQIQQVDYYSLDVIISVGYRVKSKRGIEFRRWANSILRDYLLRGYAVNQRLLKIENQLVSHQQQLVQHQEKIDFFVRTSLPPKEGIFFEGQIFDAYTFVSDRIREAKEHIALIDNYVDDSVLKMLDKRAKGVMAKVYTKNITSQLSLDIEKHNAQYAPIVLVKFDRSHDRFLCIDETVYHIGASLKDLGRKWFAFSRMEWTTSELMAKL